MPLEKQSLNINFGQGLDLKTDPFQVEPGKFLALNNTVFNKGGLLEKRNGFANLTSLDVDVSYATTFNGNLTAIGNTVQAYNAGTASWINEGEIQPLKLSTASLYRSSTFQSQSDTAISSNGLVCTVFTDNEPSNGTTTEVYKYVVSNLATGQNIVEPTEITPSSGTVLGPPKVFFLGKYFVIVFPNLISGTDYLKYFYINSINTTDVGSDITITSQYDANGNNAWGGVVANNILYLAWNGSDGGGAIRATRLDATLTLYSTEVFTGVVATVVSLCADTSGSTAVIWISVYDSASQDGYSIATNQNLDEILASTQTINNEATVNLATAATGNVLTLFYSISNFYTYAGTVETYYIKKNTLTLAGVLGTAETIIRSVDLASTAFVVDSAVFVLVAYTSDNQPTYFLINEDGVCVAKLAYSNGGGYVMVGALPSVTVEDNFARVSYLVKNQIQAVNKTQGASINGVYTQTGVNLATFEIGTSDISVSEIGSNLNLSGGYLQAYDGYNITEQGFHLWPDNVVLDDIANFTRTGDTSSGIPAITNLSSMTNITVGMTVTGSGIPANTTITAISGSTVTLSNNASATATGVTFTFAGNMTQQQYYYIATYEWADNQGNIFRSAPSIPVTVTLATTNFAVKVYVPTLRVTKKINTPVKIVLYRWSTAQQTYYQCTSINVPILNDTTVDYIEYIDVIPDTSIVGNNILYTTGGVVENIGAPATDVTTLFKNRLVLLDAENKNVIWYSKPVVQASPVEMSDAFTIYVGPVKSAQGSPGTGPITALSAMDDKLIIFKEDAIYYVTGDGPDITGANNNFSEPVFITSTVGCNNQQSIVFMPKGLMFQSSKGIWLLGRDLSTTYIGAPVEDFNNTSVLSSVNVPDTNQVRFTLDNDQMLMYDYFYDQWGSFVGAPAISSTIYDGYHTIVNEYGTVLQERSGFYLDGNNPVLISFTTSWFNVAGLQGFERAYFMHLLGVYKSPHKLSVGIAYDYFDSVTQLTTISPINYSEPYGGDPFWGSGSPYGGPGNVEQWRLFFERQKCQSFRVTVTEQYDPSYGEAAGAGLTLSGLNLTIGIKGNYPRVPAATQVG
jgi:hypothetical protein